MKKIDLHLHTIESISDNPFTFSLNKLKQYIDTQSIDCIAITNHNLFDSEQFILIQNELDIKVFPGIEIDLEGGHILLITNENDIEDFQRKCDIVKSYIQSPRDSITVEKLKEIFPNLHQYLLIPHYEKSPNIKSSTLKKLEDHITAGEVTSVKKFKTCLKDPDKLTPLIFSDHRFTEFTSTFPVKQTYIDIEEITLSGIKGCLVDKGKVFLTKEDGNAFFPVSDNGLKLSTGLNVILGERSSGKTHTLNLINSSFENVKYIPQFSLLQNEPERFDEQLKINQSHISEQYLKEFQDVFSTINVVDIKINEITIENYLTSLLKSASENDMEDSYSRATLFTEQLYPEKQSNTLESLITSTLNLLENTEYRGIIDKHVSVQSLTELLIELVLELQKEHEINSKKIWVNELMTDIKEILKFRTSSTLVEDVNFYKILSDNEKVKKFVELVHQVQKNREIHRDQMQGFKITATAKKFTGASQLKQKSRRNTGFSNAFNLYSEPYKYLLELKKIDILESIEYYKYFVNVEYKTLNKHGFPVSGGERSEFNLLQHITDALKFDLLLIDEPESSFDNTFLKNDVNELLKEISKQMPVIIVTHNNTVGASIYPDYLIYTKKNILASEITYQIFMGYPHSKKLKDLEGEETNNYDILLKCLEAGTEAYNERKLRNYDVLKN